VLTAEPLIRAFRIAPVSIVRAADRLLKEEILPQVDAM
jgi:hypothetical protein